MIQCLTPFQGGFHEDAKVIFDLFLADIFRQLRRPKRRLELCFLSREVFVADVDGGCGHLDDQNLRRFRIAVEHYEFSRKDTENAKGW